MMERWKQFLDSLNTPGGHIFVLTVLFCGTLLLVTYHDPSLREVMMIFIGALGNEMRGQLANTTVQKSITESTNNPKPDELPQKSL